MSSQNQVQSLDRIRETWVRRCTTWAIGTAQEWRGRCRKSIQKGLTPIDAEPGQNPNVALPFSAYIAMSQQQPDIREQVEVDLFWAIVQETNFGDAKTVLKFSISDGEWKAFYVFEESISPVAQRNFGLARANTPLFRMSLRDVGLGALPSVVRPSTPRRVDDFVLRPGPARANLRRFDRGSVVRLLLAVEVAKNQFEQWPMFLKPPRGSVLPARLELGWVHFDKLELL
ncbi:MAG: hypothetical protein DCC68_11685 [Planctomycetota bacterium]|nr:MAG: hypothetical protein DCC68_11685 [Planctomycetota bacterium]